jgi:hypothetical protein
MKKVEIGLLFIVIISTSILSFNLFNPADLWWDSAVYVGIGKHIFSLGESGLWEASRPLVWPAILGFYWKLGLDPIFFGRLTNILFNLGCIVLTYLIAIKLFNEKIALISAIFLTFSPTFFRFTTILYTGIAALFFILLSLFFLLKKRYALSGLFLGIAVMTRFFFGFAAVAVFIFLLVKIMKKEKYWNNLVTMVIFFLIPVVPFFILNYILYSNIFYPFLVQAYMTQSSNWYWYQPFYFYFIGLLKENIFILFSILGIFYLILKKSQKQLILFILIFAFIPFNFAPHKEMRFMLLSLPFIYMLASYGLLKITTNKKIIFLILLIWALFTIPALSFNDYDDKLDPFYDYTETIDTQDRIYISNPAFILNTNHKGNLMYYPIFSNELINKLNNKISSADHILVNTCDIICLSRELDCEQNRAELIQKLKNTFNEVSYEKEGQCEFHIFQK